MYYLHPSNRIIETKYGRAKGIVVGFPEKSGLQRIDAFRGLQFATSRGTKLRFMPPSSSLERWHGATRLVMEHRPVCPQPIVHERKLRKSHPKEHVEQLKRIAPNISRQLEECLSLNLYVPKGKIS